MDFSFEVSKKDKKSLARAGVIHTSHGDILTPAFSPVATKASVKTLTPDDLRAAKTQVVLGNTYHLYLKPGTETLKKFGGFGPFMRWHGPTISDSGGYQVSFLRSKSEDGRLVKITDKGAIFSSYLDGSRHLITPEKSMEIQKILAGDIIMAFDQPRGRDYFPLKKKEAFERTMKWEERSFSAWKKLKSNQALYGIVQGDIDRSLRRKSLKFVLSLGFPGIAMGGESIGVSPKITAETLDTIADILPLDKPLHALGLGGGPEGIFTAVQRGVDTFDNTSITRMARTGLLFIYPEDGGSISNKFRIDIEKSKFKNARAPISNKCSCYTCKNFSAAYLHHLFLTRELLGLRLASIHNVFFVNDLMERIRNSILEGDFRAFKKYWLNWG